MTPFIHALRRVPVPFALVLPLLLLHLHTVSLQAANLTWDADGTAGGSTGGSGTWNTTSTLWNNAGAMATWNNAVSNIAIFGGTAGTVTLGENITTSGLTFSSSGYIIAADPVDPHTLSLGGLVNVTTAGHSALIRSDVNFTLASGVAGAGDFTFDSGYNINAGGFSFGKSGAGTLTMASNLTNGGGLTVSGGVMNLSGSYAFNTYGAGMTISGGTLNVTGTLGSAAIAVGQTAFSGNSVTNFSGTAYISGASSTFRVGEGTNATVNITGGTVNIGASSGGVVLGRSTATAQGFMNISGGALLITSSGTRLRIGAGYSDTENSGASVLTLSGTGLLDTATSTGDILLGSNLAGNTASTGTLNLNGGTLSTLRVIRGGSVGASIFNFNGGTLKANGAAMTLHTSLTTVNVRDGGGIIDTNGFNVSIAKALTHSNISGDAAIDGGLTKTGAGVLTYTGADANTYTGVTRVYAGELALSKTAGVNAIAGDVIIGDGLTTALLRLINADQIADTSVITLQGLDANAGVFRLNGKNETIGGLASVNGEGIVENESATNAVLTLNNTGTQSYSGILRNGTSAGTLSLVKNGSGTQILAGATTYTGSTTINAGTLQFGIDNALNATTPLILAASGGVATLSLDGNAWTSGAITFYNATSTSTSQAVMDLGTDGVLTLGSSTFTLNNNNNPLGAMITGGTLDLGGATRTFAIADSSNALADLTIASNITTSAGAFGLIKTGAGTLRLTGNANFGGSITVNGGVLEIAGVTAHPSATANTLLGSTTATAVMRIVDGGDYTTGTFSIGIGATYKGGALVMNGGVLTVNPTSVQSGISLGGPGYGGLFLSGGTINTKRVDSGDGTTDAAISVLRVDGGTLNTSRYIMFRNERWEFTVTGGKVVRTGEGIALAFRSGGTPATATSTAQGAMTIAGGEVDNGILTVTFGQQNDASALGTAHLNLNAGTFINNRINFYNGAGTALTAFVNFNGGLWKVSQTGSLIATVGSGGTGSIKTYVNGAFGNFAGGAVIDSNGFTPTISTALLAPTGNGVTSITVTGGGSGYIGAPYVEISGGGGSGATAYATVDLDPNSPTYGQVTGIVVTNPGRDYTSTPTITLKGGGGTGALVGTVTTSENTSGGLTKLGAGTLILSGTEANTYTGMTSVHAGELHLSKTAGVTAIAGNVTIGNASAPAVLKLLNNDQIADTSVIAFTGTGANAGILRLNGKTETVGGLESTGGSGVVENQSDTSTILTLDTSTGTHTYSGILRDGDASSASLSVMKTGAGTQVLSGANTYTGGTAVSGGTLIIAATGRTGEGAVMVQNGGVLAGTGTVRGSSFTAEHGSVIHAGDGTTTGDRGTLTFTHASTGGTFEFQHGSKVILDLDADDDGDLLSFDGISNGALIFDGDLQVRAAGYVPTFAETFNLLDWTNLSYVAFASQYDAASYSGYLLGNGDDSLGFDLPDISASGYAWDISQFTVNGTISTVVVPEPTRMMLMLVGACGILLRRRRGE